MSPKKILIFSLSYFPLIGGAEVAIKEITDRISDFEFDMITMRFDKSHPKFERVGNVNVYRVGGGLGYFSKILFVPQAVLFSLRHKYDAYWVMMTYMLFPVSILRLLGKKVPYILTLQDGDPFTHVFGRLRILLFRPLLSYGFRNAIKVQTISNYLANWVREMGYKGKLKVIPNGVNVEKFMSVGQSRASTKRAIVLITVSRLVEKNGIQDIINALKFLPKNVKLKILGVGPLESNLKSMATGLPVEFLDLVPQDEIPKYLHDADIFVRPSLSEGMGSSFIEAMAAGLPVIATPVGGILDFLKDGETGLFCKIKNPRSIAEQVERLINNSNLRQKLSENGQKLVREKYDWDLVAKRMKEEIFDPAIAGQVR